MRAVSEQPRGEGMEGFVKLLESLPEYRKIAGALRLHNTPLLATGLSNIHKAHFIASLHAAFEKAALAVVSDEAAAVRLCEDIRIMSGDPQAAFLYPSRELCYYEVDSVSREYEHARLAVLGALSAGKKPVVVCSAQAALQYTIPPEILKARTMTLHQGEQKDPSQLEAFLLAAGYTRCDQVEGVCQFSRRGGLLDFFPPHMPDPFRIEFWGD